MHSLLKSSLLLLCSLTITTVNATGTVETVETVKTVNAAGTVETVTTVKTVEAPETVTCKNGRCTNTKTDNLWSKKLSFKPVFTNRYEINLVGHLDPCEGGEATKTPLPKNSYFKQTSDNDVQNKDQKVIHVYESNVSSSDHELFKKPFKLCLNGENRVPKSSYVRVGGIDTGILVVPFKLRSGDIYSDAAIGPYISYKWEYVDLLALAGISQISVSEIGSENIETETGLTGAVGINIEIDTDWDVAFLVGVDHLSGDKGDNWQYQDKAWVSFGIGYNFTQ